MMRCGDVIIVFSNWIVLAASQWGEWGSFNTCDNTCGGGIQTRSRSCLTEPCAGDLFDFQACAYNECPEDGMWAEWGMWSICSQSCDGGLQERDRQCFGPFHGGQECTGDSRDSQTCNQFGCPIDGGWSTWSPFTSCTSTCGGGTRTATRTCDHPVPENNGRDCLGSSSLTEACNSQVCEEAAVVDGEWGPWSLVGDCSADCGVGVRTRSRSCTNPAPTNGGLECPGDDNEEFQCQGPPCPVNGGWGWWQEWSACSQSCLGGLRERRRICDGPPPMNGGDDCVDSTPGAPGEQWQEAECNTGPCQVIDGMWGEWSIVGRCSQTCDGGYQPRVRYCNNPQPVNGGRMCPGGDAEATARDTDQVGCRFNPCPIHGSWGVWSNYTACAATCGISVQTRTRACNNPAPEYGGVECVGTNIDTLDCGLDECFVDGGWSIWSPFGPCTETCGGGSQHRIRECTNPAPSGNGQPCSGVANDTRTCNIDPCPAVNGAWGNWGHWDDCSTSCGVGVRTRIRPCDSPAPEYGGELCPGRSTASRSCDMGVCPQDLSSLYGVCNSWSFWSECSVTCAGGKSERTRTCTDRPPADSDITCDVMATKEIEILLCNEEACPVNGYWSPWQYWSSCSVSCGSGVMSRQRHCDNPSPRNGGRICEGASVYQDSETMKVPCFLSACQDRTTTTTTTPSPNQDGVTVPQTVCPSEIAHDELVWPITDIGESVNIACPLPSTGNTTRTCMAADVWSEMDTSSCVNHNFDQLGEDLEIVDLWSNVTALTVVLEMFREACSPENIAVGEDLRTCQQIVMTLIHKNLPGNPTIPRNVKDPMIKNLLHGVGGIVDPGNKQQWRSIHKAEETEHVSLISDIVYSVEMFGRQVAAYLMENNRGSFCPVGITNLDFCVERINCEEVSFRYPKDPPDPTPPPKHIRGGWVAPEKPKLTYVTFSNDLMKEVACAPAMLSTDVYAVTVVHEDLHKLLPDANKQYIDPDEEALAGVRYSRRPNSHVISSLVVSPVNTTHLNAPLQIKLYHNKSAESAACAFMPKSLDTSIYSTDGCSISKQQENFTICECNHMTPFLLIMQPIYIPPKEDITSKSDGFMKASCIIVLLCMLAMGATYIFSKLWHTDRYFIISNMAFAMFLAELFILVGGITQDQHGCRFLAFMIHYLVTASQIWVLAVVTHAYKEIESHDQFSTNERRLYTLLSWAVPIFAPAITIGLDYDDYIMDDFCWMEWKKRVALGFYGPQVSICLVGIVVLLYCYRILDTKDKSTLTEEVEQMTYDKQRHYLLRVGGLLAATSINWTCFCVMITPLFMATNIIMGACVIVLFAVLDHDVQIALGNRRNDLKEAKRRKAHEVKLSAEMPDWVKQTQTQNRPMYFPPSEVNAPYGKEKIELFSREKDSPSPPGFAYMPKDKRKLTPHF